MRSEFEVELENVELCRGDESVVVSFVFSARFRSFILLNVMERGECDTTVEPLFRVDDDFGFKGWVVCEGEGAAWSSSPLVRWGG